VTEVLFSIKRQKILKNSSHAGAILLYQVVFNISEIFSVIKFLHVVYKSLRKVNQLTGKGIAKCRSNPIISNFFYIEITLAQKFLEINGPNELENTYRTAFYYNVI
jgi:hypothetical protein